MIRYTSESEHLEEMIFDLIGLRPEWKDRSAVARQALQIGLEQMRYNHEHSIYDFLDGAEAELVDAEAIIKELNPILNKNAA